MGTRSEMGHIQMTSILDPKLLH